MSKHTAPGRLLRQSIAEDVQFNNLSLEAQLLYLLLRPHFSAWGKLKADPHTIKGTVVPLNAAYNPHTIARCLEEISDRTPVKLFHIGGIPYLHDLAWDSHQNIRKDRGRDRLPGYPLTEEPPTRHGATTETQNPPRAVTDALPRHSGAVTIPDRGNACRGP